MVTFEQGVGQAVYFAYAMSARGNVQSQWDSIERNVKRKGDAERAEHQAEKAVTGSRINLEGLSAKEIDAQRALIQFTVDGLPPMQSRAIKSRYCRGWEQNGAIGLLAPMLPKVADSSELQRLLVYAVYGLASIRAICREFAVHHRIVDENLSVMRKNIAAIESVAFASLESKLSGCGLID